MCLSSGNLGHADVMNINYFFNMKIAQSMSSICISVIYI